MLKKPIRSKCNENINTTALICIHWIPQIFFGSGEENWSLCPGRSCCPQSGLTRPSARGMEGAGRDVADAGTRFAPLHLLIPTMGRMGTFEGVPVLAKLVASPSVWLKLNILLREYRHFKTWFGCAQKREFFVHRIRFLKQLITF